MKLLMSIGLLLVAGKAISQNTTQDTIKARNTDSVVITAQAKAFNFQADKTILNVDNQPTAAGKNVLELLKSAPSVVVDANDQIGMNGKKGVQVLLNGKLTYLTGQDLTQLLKSIDASTIKQIEIITNPSAKYDAAGNAGIINIILKKGLYNGTNGSVGFSYQQSVHARGSQSLVFNSRKNQWNFFAQASATKGNQHTIANNDRTTTTKNYIQKSIEGDLYHTINSRVGVDYSLNQSTVVGVMWMLNQHNTTMNNHSTTLMQQKGQADSLIQTNSLAPFTNSSQQLNFNFSHNKTKQQLNIDVDLLQYNSGLNNTVQNTLFNNIGTSLSSNGLQNLADVDIKVLAAKLDYTLQLPKNAMLEIGAKMAISHTNNSLQVQQNSNAQSWQQDSGKTNTFIYQEHIAAAYISYKKERKKWTIKAGLRAEHTDVEGNSIQLNKQSNQKPDSSYVNLFPTLFVQYRLHANHQLQLSYGKRIDRPNYQDQNPFVYVLDAFNSQVGNPYLIPQITHSIELGYVYKNSLQFKLSYSHTNHYIEQITYQDQKNTVMIPQNAGNRKMLSLNMSSPFTLSNWWNGYANVEPFFQQYQTTFAGYGTAYQTKNNSLGLNLYCGNWFALGKGFTAELSGWFNYQNTTTMYTALPLGSMNIGFAKKIWQNKMQIKLAMNDVFNTQRWQQTAQGNQWQITTYRKWESSNLSLAINYKFGSSKAKAVRTRNDNSLDESNRIKK